MPRQINRMQDITFNIAQHLGTLGKSQSGWTKEVNLVEWNDKPAKLDIREWDPEHEHMSRGVTLRRGETLALLEILVRYFGKELAASKTEEEQEPGEFDDLCADAEDSCDCECSPVCGPECSPEYGAECGPDFSPSEEF